MIVDSVHVYGSSNRYYLRYCKHTPTTDIITSNATALFILLYRFHYCLYSCAVDILAYSEMDRVNRVHHCSDWLN